MKPMTRLLCLAVLATATVVTAPAATASAGDEINTDGDTCCFSNPRYSGVCQVTTGPDETCADVLAYLNNQASVGKTYCGNTKVRGGWTQVECETSSSSCTPVEPAPERPAE